MFKQELRSSRILSQAYHLQNSKACSKSDFILVSPNTFSSLINYYAMSQHHAMPANQMFHPTFLIMGNEHLYQTAHQDLAGLHASKGQVYNNSAQYVPSGQDVVPHQSHMPSAQFSSKSENL